MLTVIIGAAAACFILLASFVIWQNLQRQPTIASAPAVELDEDLADTVSQERVEPRNQRVSASPRPASLNTRITESADLASLVQRIEGAIVLITTQDASGADVSLGTGFVIDASALIATNFHVIREATSAQVHFRDGQRFEVAGCRAVDKQADLAILELKSRPAQVTVLPLSNSEAPPQGTGVVAVGHPAGFKFVVTQGIVSAVHKTSELPEQYQQFIGGRPDHVWIQTSAAISPGSSGGPLLSESGEVIGINTWVAAGQNLGFASHSRHLAELRKKLKPTATALNELNQDKKQNDFASNLDPQVLRLFEEYIRAQLKFREQLENASSPEQVRTLLTKNNVVERYLNEFWRLAERNPRTPAALQSLLIVYQIASSLRMPESKSFIERSSQKITADHLEDPELCKALFILGQDTSRQTIGLLQQIASNSSQRPTKGTAYFLHAAILSQKEGRRRRYKHEIASLLDRVQSEYGDVSVLDTTLGNLAGDLKFEIEHLSLGAVAPDIVGKDASGKDIRLSDHRGKVIVIDFFADWCPYCRRMYPDERQYCQEFQDKPFSLLGINCDSPARLAKLLDSNAITWPCVADGAEGPIAKKWRIDSYPTVFVLDAKGVIRHRFSGDPGTQLRSAIEDLLAEAEGRKKETAGVDLDAELGKLKDSLVAESPVTVVGKAIDLLLKNRAEVKPDHVKLVEGWLRSATKQDPKASYLPYFRASLFLIKDEYPAAIKSYREVLKRPDVPPPARAGAQNSLAYLLAMRRDKNEDLKEAETLIEHASATLSGVPAVMDTKAMVLLWKGEHDEACELLEECLDHEIRASVYFHLAVVEMARGDKKAAKASLEEAMDAGFKPESLIKLERRIHEQLTAKINDP